jgi:2-C-methyl-D-erythritol 4-phosphate cytidylyltransferase
MVGAARPNRPHSLQAMPEVNPVRAACIVVAAGSGSRLGAEVPKAFVALAGEPLLAHAVRNVASSGAIDLVVVVAPHDWLDRAEKVATDATAGTSASVAVVAGGATRQHSVAAGLDALPDDVGLVLVHDAARCLAPPSLVARVVEAVQAGHRAVVPGLFVADTMKRVQRGRDVDRVTETIDRDELRIAQTPQGFTRATLTEAHRAAAEEEAELAAHGLGGASLAELVPRYTDDAEMAEEVATVVVVPGDPLAFKITLAEDLAYAEWLLARDG